MEILYRAFIYAEKYRMEIIGLFFAVSFLMGVSIYASIYQLGVMDTISYSLGLFAMDVKTPGEISDLTKGIDFSNEHWKRIFIASTLAKFTVILSVFLLFFRSALSTWYRQKVIRNGKHTIVVGLGRNSRFFINSMLKHEEHKMVVFEKHKENHYLEHYRNKRVALVKEDVEIMLNDLNINEAKNIFISTGNDESNIYLAMKFIAEVDDSNAIEKLVVHIEDRTLRNLYDNEKALYKDNLDLRPFSFYKEASRCLFKSHALEGDDCDIMQSFSDFNILIIGNSEFSVSLISEACRLSNLPNENHLHIHCMGLEKEKFEEKVLYAFPYINNIKNVSIHYIEADSKSLEFYKHKVWYLENLTHVIYADDSVLENIRISTKVSDTTYLREQSSIEKTKFHIATMNHIKVADEIRKEFKSKNVFTCAEANIICSRENLLENEVDLVAKMIQYTYESNHFRNYNVKIRDNAINRMWREASVNDKRTSVAQAIHINTKLKILGLKSKKVSPNIKLYHLYKRNLKALNASLKNDMKHFGLDSSKLYEMEQAYRKKYEVTPKEGFFFPNEYKTNLEKMLRMEHNRWMTVLTLMDNIRADEAVDMSRDERKKLKVHHLLKPLDEFKTTDERIYIINDIHSIKNIARYMALTYYEIVDFYED